MTSTHPATLARPAAAGGRRATALRSPLVPVSLLVVQQLLHRNGANPWFGFPFHVLALCWIVLVSVGARHRITRFGGLLAAFGGSLNAVAIAASNAMMPTDPVVFRSVHHGPFFNRQRMHVAVTSGWRHFLGDRIAVRSLTSVISIGDVVLLIGGVIALAGFVLALASSLRPTRRVALTSEVA